jgi:Tfp pilus assembly protein PilX
MRSRFARSRGDDGAALVIVLIVITVIALGLSALLSFSDTSIRTTVGLRDQAAATYDGDGAMQAAVNNLRNSTYNNATGQDCLGPNNTLELKNFYGADSAAVTCAADPAKVLIQCPSLSKCNRPGNAILTLGQIAGEDGLNIQQPTGSTFRVHGNVFSNSNINVVNGALNTNAHVWARTTCAGTIQSTPAPSCNYGSAANTLGDDPGYQPVATIASLPHRSLPSCSTPNSLIKFQPGYYDDAKGLSDMMAGNSPCRHSTWWFPPEYDASGKPSATGVYYFDFHNSGSNANPLLNSSGGNIWTVNDGSLVGGTPVNAAGAAIAAPAVPASIPGSCDNPINNAAAIGVQFIFGGDSQFAVKAGQAEICGTYNVERTPVALYGLTSGSETTTAWTGSNALKLTTVGLAGAFGATATPARLADVDGTAATWTSTSKNDSALLKVSGFAPPSSIPVGSILQSAAIKVTHRHSDPASTDDFSVSVETAPSTTVTGSAPGRAGGTTYQTDSIPLDTARTGALARAIYNGTYSGATIALTTNLSNPNKNETEDIDSIQLELTFTPPALRAGSDCVTHGPYTGVGSASTCALVTAVNNAGNEFYVQGTTYAPKAALDITLNNAAEQVFRFGVIARSVWVKETGSFSYGGVVIEVPDDSPGFVFGMYLKVYLCPKSPTCSPSGSPVLQSKVALVDTDPSAPDPGHRQVTVLSWTRPG